MLIPVLNAFLALVFVLVTIALSTYLNRLLAHLNTASPHYHPREISRDTPRISI